MSKENRVALISIIVEKSDNVARLNEILHNYSEYVIGRMGIPYREKSISIISVAVDAPEDAINTLTGSIGKLDGVTAKATYSKV
ncbi:MAG: iron-only hydrogenase system regulator [Clostridia bacterium]|jgi:putative iron-only hydrogenase system regulator|nr:iron-only hydrogenase system regulator [Clostridia bacterium]